MRCVHRHDRAAHERHTITSWLYSTYCISIGLREIVQYTRVLRIIQCQTHQISMDKYTFGSVAVWVRGPLQLHTPCFSVVVGISYQIIAKRALFFINETIAEL